MDQINKAIASLTDAKAQIDEGAKALIGTSNQKAQQLLARSNEISQQITALTQVNKSVDSKTPDA